MNKRNCFICLTMIIFMALFGFAFYSNNKIVTFSKKVYTSNEEVTLRELALLMSIVYEDVPNDSNYQNSKSNNTGCIKNGRLLNNCSYTHYRGVRYKRDNFNVEKYIEGMSDRKLNLFTAITTTKAENGELYYFQNLAATSEAYDWKVDNYITSESIGLEDVANMDAVTFKKGNNYVIAYRGTDFPDLLEWVQDIFYIKGEHAQADAAYEYAQNEYDRIVRANPNANIYVTGHSLGGYLAQVGGIAIVEKEKNSSNQRLAQVAYFNGMGISGLGINNGSINTWINDLQYLASHDRNGNEVTSTSRLTNYSTPSSGRLVLYQMGKKNGEQGDPVSELGVHFGEVIRLEAAQTSIDYHNGSHALFLNGSWEEYFTTIPTNVKTYIQEVIKNLQGLTLEDIGNQLNSSINNTSSKINESLTNSIYLLAKASEITKDDIYAVFNSAVGMPSAIDSRIRTAGKTIQGVLTLIGDIVSGITGDISVIEKANIFHETDSFLCVPNESGGIPSVMLTAHIDNENVIRNNFVLKSAITTKENPNAVSIVNYGGSDVALDIITEDGCATSYAIYETTGGTRKLYTSSDNYSYDSYFTINAVENTPEKRTFEVVVNYGTTLYPMRLNSLSAYEKNGTVINDYKDKVVHKVELVLDKEGPICTSQEYTDVTIDKGKEQRRTIEFTCKDSSNIIDELTNISVSYENNGAAPFNHSLSVDIDDIEVKRVSSTEIKIQVPIDIKVRGRFTNPSIYISGTVRDAYQNSRNVLLGRKINITEKATSTSNSCG